MINKLVVALSSFHIQGLRFPGNTRVLQQYRVMGLSPPLYREFSQTDLSISTPCLQQYRPHPHCCQTWCIVGTLDRCHVIVVSVLVRSLLYFTTTVLATKPVLSFVPIAIALSLAPCFLTSFCFSNEALFVATSSPL